MLLSITYFVHGTTTDNERGIATGWLSGELSQRGRQQAAKLGEQVDHLKFDAIYSSDLQRAVESAELGFGSRYRVTHDARLRECNYGEFDGQPASLFKSNLEDYIHSPFPNGESYLQVEQRMRDFVGDIIAANSLKHIAIVAHQAPQLALEVIANHRTWAEAIHNDWRKTGAWKPGWTYQINEPPY